MTPAHESGSARPIATVADLIDRLNAFDGTAPIAAQGVLADKSDIVLGVSESPNEPGTIAVIYTPRPDSG